MQEHDAATAATAATGARIYLCTLPEAIMLCCGTLSTSMRGRLASQILPGWREAISAHDEKLTKTILIGGRYKLLSALPLQRAAAVVEMLCVQTVTRLQEELVQMMIATMQMQMMGWLGEQDVQNVDAFCDDDALDM